MVDNCLSVDILWERDHYHGNHYHGWTRSYVCTAINKEYPFHAIDPIGREYKTCITKHLSHKEYYLLVVH
jgi:hypothetical protein